MFHGKNLRQYRVSSIGSIYSVTVCTPNKRQYFKDFEKARVVVNALRFQDSRDYTKTFAFVLMPDHLHWLFEIKKSVLSTILHSVKSYSSHKVGCQLWQERYFEHALRTEESLIKHSRYIVGNPLRAGIVENIGDYSYWDAIWLTGEI